MTPTETLASDRIDIDRKTFFFDLRANQRGLVLRLTEQCSGHRNTLMVPAEALRDVGEMCIRMADYAEQVNDATV